MNNEYMVLIYWAGCILALVVVLMEITREIDIGNYKEENINYYVFSLAVFPLFSWILVVPFLLVILFKNIKGEN